MQQNKKIGLCISGGGVRGMAAISIIEKLLASGFTFSAISGTSVGAIIGAYLAIHGEVTSLREKYLNRTSREWLGLADVSLTSKQSILHGTKIRSIFKEMYGDTQIDELKTSLITAATDLQSGKVKYFNTGSVYDAVAASSAYPGIFPPHVVDGKPYVDGGVLDNLPYEVLLNKGVDKVIAINLLHIADRKEESFTSMTAILSRSYDLMMANALKYSVSSDERVFIFTTELSKTLTAAVNVNNIEEYYKAGEQVFEKRRDELFEWLG